MGEVIPESMHREDAVYELLCDGLFEYMIYEMNYHEIHMFIRTLKSLNYKVSDDGC